MGRKTSQGCSGGSGNGARAAMPFRIRGWALRRTPEGSEMGDGRPERRAVGCAWQGLYYMAEIAATPLTLSVWLWVSCCSAPLSAFNPAFIQTEPFAPTKDTKEKNCWITSISCTWFNNKGCLPLFLAGDLTEQPSNPIRSWRALLELYATLMTLTSVGCRLADGADWSSKSCPKPPQMPVIMPMRQCGCWHRTENQLVWLARLDAKPSDSPLKRFSIIRGLISCDETLLHQWNANHCSNVWCHWLDKHECWGVLNTCWLALTVVNHPFVLDRLKCLRNRTSKQSIVVNTLGSFKKDRFYYWILDSCNSPTHYSLHIGNVL